MYLFLGVVAVTMIWIAISLSSIAKSLRFPLSEKDRAAIKETTEELKASKDRLQDSVEKSKGEGNVNTQ